VTTAIRVAGGEDPTRMSFVSVEIAGLPESQRSTVVTTAAEPKGLDPDKPRDLTRSIVLPNP
jgi:hypothetical protein